MQFLQKKILNIGQIISNVFENLVEVKGQGDKDKRVFSGAHGAGQKGKSMESRKKRTPSAR